MVKQEMKYTETIDLSRISCTVRFYSLAQIKIYKGVMVQYHFENRLHITVCLFGV